MMKHWTLIFLLLPLCFHSAKALGPRNPKHEARAVWLTTLGGLDWPHAKGIEAQKQELRDILDRLAAAQFNIVFFQTRIRNSVVYPSALEPWDACLTGQSGKSPGYDPLAFAVEECHRRHMQLHAWVVAFPAPRPADHTMKRLAIQHRHPELCMKADNGWMLNPGLPQTADYLSDICLEIATHYDVDGIHLDYIRYPESSVSFNDLATYRRYGHGESKAQWRRNNISRCVKAVHDAVKAVKPWVWLSCAPIGKYNDLPRQSSGSWNAFHAGHQDAQLWLREGWVDMLLPMMYFRANHHFFPFALDWKEAAGKRPVVNGLGAYFLSPREKGGDWALEEIEREMQFSRAIQSGGQCFFRSQFVTENTKGLYDFLKDDFYRQPALPPALCSDSATAPAPPRNPLLVQTDKGWRLEWEMPAEAKAVGPLEFTVYSSYEWPIETETVDHVLLFHLNVCQHEINLPIPKDFLPYYAVTATDRYGNESRAAFFNAPVALRAATDLTEGQQISMKQDRLLLPADSRAGFLMITDEAGRTVSTLPYCREVNTASLAPGLYTLRTLEPKGVSHVLGHYLKRP